MSVVRKTVTLTDQQHDWVKMRIGSKGDLIRRDLECSMALQQLRTALEEGERSGISGRCPQDIIQAARKRLQADGKIQA